MKWIPQRLWQTLLLLFLLAVVSFGSIAKHIISYPNSNYCQADIIVVMGAAQYNGKPSPAFQRRLDLAYKLYQQNCGDRVLVTGGVGDGDHYSEGEVGVQYLSSRGIIQSDLQSERLSRSSYQNLHNSFPLLVNQDVLIVTDDYHAYRTAWLAHYLELSAHVSAVPSQQISLEQISHELASLFLYFFGIFR